VMAAAGWSAPGFRGGRSGPNPILSSGSIAATAGRADSGAAVARPLGIDVGQALRAASDAARVALLESGQPRPQIRWDVNVRFATVMQRQGASRPWWRLASTACLVTSKNSTSCK
jgi:hypothetical protein